MEDTHTPYKLTTTLTGTDKYIFVNRAGSKVTEYTLGQLAHLVLTENNEIPYAAAEFESALAIVVIQPYGLISVSSAVLELFQH